MSGKFKTALQWLLAAGGLALFVHLGNSIGWDRVAIAFRLHGQWIVLLTLVYVVYHWLRTWTLQISIPYPSRIRDLFGVRLAGEALAYVAIGSVLGDALKVVLQKEKIPVVEGATGVFAEKLIYHLSGTGFIMFGLWIAVFRLGAHSGYLYGIGAMLILFTGFLFLLSSGVRPIAAILSHIRERKPALRRAILRTEESLFQYRKLYPQRFTAVFLLNFVSYFYAVAETQFVLWILGIPCSWVDLWYYQAVVKIANAAALAVPANIGVFEAGNVLAARQLNLGEEAGLVTALFIRIRAIVWSLIGYFWLLHLVGKGKGKG